MTKRFLPILVMLVLCCSPCTVLAAEGTIRMEMPEDMRSTTIYYSKDGEEEKEIFSSGKSQIVLSNLQAGSYQIRIESAEGYSFAPTKINVPMWSEEEHKMLYDITIVPKYSRNVESPKTEDNAQGATYAGIGLISLIIVAIISCHNRFKCGRMSRKYSN